MVIFNIIKINCGNMTFIGNYVIIKHLSIKNEKGKIKMNWELLNLAQNTLNQPVTCTIRYKVINYHHRKLKNGIINFHFD